MKRQFQSPVNPGLSEGWGRVTRFAGELLFPPRCGGCGALMPAFSPESTAICADCAVLWDEALAEGRALAAKHREPVFLLPYHSGRSDGMPEGLLYRVKHEGDPRLFRYLARNLEPAVRKALGSDRLTDTLRGDIPLFSYPPRRKSAVRENGFDQAERLARALAAACDGEYASLLRRTRRGRAEQKTLGAVERKANATLAYALRPSAVPLFRGRTVVLCDDLYTTGSTLRACADLLLASGAKRVIPVTVAKTVGKATPPTPEGENHGEKTELP